MTENCKAYQYPNSCSSKKKYFQLEVQQPDVVISLLKNQSKLTET